MRNSPRILFAGLAAGAVLLTSCATYTGQTITWGEIHVGHRKVFAAAGFEEVSHPSKRRCVMRIEF